MRRSFDLAAIMRQAHADARRFMKEEGGRYADHFAWALKMAWVMARAEAASEQIKSARAEIVFIDMIDRPSMAHLARRSVLVQQLAA